MKVLIQTFTLQEGGSYLSVHEQSQGEGHSQAPLSKILLTVHSGVGVARRETHEQGSFAGRAVEERPVVVSGSPRLFSAALRGQRSIKDPSNRSGHVTSGFNSHLPWTFFTQRVKKNQKGCVYYNSGNQAREVGTVVVGRRCIDGVLSQRSNDAGY